MKEIHHEKHHANVTTELLLYLIVSLPFLLEEDGKEMKRMHI